MSIDTCGACHCVQIEEGSRDCTAFFSSFDPLHPYSVWLSQRRKCLFLDAGSDHLDEPVKEENVEYQVDMKKEYL